MKVSWFQCDLDLKFYKTTIFREKIDQASRIWSLILKTCVSHQLHLWHEYLRLFLGTAEDRNNHELKVVNLDVGMKDSGQCQGSKAGAWQHSKNKKNGGLKRGQELLKLRY